MGGKNKGGREVRKPKQDKKAKGGAKPSTIPPTARGSGEHPTK